MKDSRLKGYSSEDFLTYIGSSVSLRNITSEKYEEARMVEVHKILKKGYRKRKTHSSFFVFDLSNFKIYPANMSLPLH